MIEQINSYCWALVTKMSENGIFQINKLNGLGMKHYTNKTARFGGLICLLGAEFVFSGLVLAAASIEGPPEYSVYDRNDVNLVTGKRSIHKTDLSIGNGDSSLTHTISSYADNFEFFTDNFVGRMTTQGERQVQFGDFSNTFTLSNGDYVDRQKNGASLVEQSDGNWLYTSNNGALLTLSPEINLVFKTVGEATVTKVVYPNGYEIKLHFKARPYIGHPRYEFVHRIQSVTSNTGLQLKYSYASNSDTADIYAWSRPVEITAINNAIEYCDPEADSCALTGPWPSVKYTWPANILTAGGDFVITEPDGKKSIYTHELFCRTGPGTEPCTGNNNPRISKVTESTSTGIVTSRYDYANQYTCHNAGVSWDCTTISENIIWHSYKGGATWTYDYSIPSSQYVPKQVSSSGSSATKTIWLNNYIGVPSKIIDHELGSEFKLNESYGNRIESVSYDYGSNSLLGYNGRSIHFKYDSIGNLIERREKPTPDSSEADIVSSASYDNNCDNPKTQKSPAWVKDAKSNQTDFTYHCESGKVATLTKPANVNAIRPQVRYVYEEKYALYKNTSNALVQADSPIWLLTQESYCKSSASTATGCALSGDEVITTYDYGTNTEANNLFLKGVVTSAEGETHRTCYDYDDYGNKLSETQPNANLASCQ